MSQDAAVHAATDQDQEVALVHGSDHSSQEDSGGAVCEQLAEALRFKERLEQIRFLMSEGVPFEEAQEEVIDILRTGMFGSQP